MATGSSAPSGSGFSVTRTRVLQADSGALLTYLFILAYASLNPFIGWRWPEAFTLFSSPRYIIAFDVMINIAAYAPIGAMLASLLRQRAQIGALKLAGSVRIWCVAVAACAVVSLCLELAQAFLPGRVSSFVDLLANTVGAGLGAGLVLAAPGKILIAAWQQWRNRHFSAGNLTGWGLILLALWIIAQLNPAIPFFEAGHIANAIIAGSTNPYDPLVLLPQAVGIMFNVCGFVLFVALLLPPNRSVMLNVLVLATVSVVLKLAMAGMMLKAPEMIDWLAPARIVGLTAGLIVAACFLQLGFRWRAFWATLFVFAGGLMAKITSIYGAFDETLRMFYWPHGQLVNFAGLTRWINEIWPLLAVIFLATLFVTRHEPH